MLKMTRKVASPRLIGINHAMDPGAGYDPRDVSLTNEIIDNKRDLKRGQYLWAGKR